MAGSELELTPTDPDEVAEVELTPKGSETMDEEEENNFFLSLAQDYEKEDEFFRSGHLRSLKKKELYWRGEQRLFWNDSDGAYRSINDLTVWEREEYDLNSYDRVINVYRPWGESIIAALSIQTPGVAFYPDDADNPNDLMTAKAYSKLSDSLQKHNAASMLFVKALHILYNQGMIGFYNYLHTSEAYGIRKVPQIDYKETQHLALDPQTGEMKLVTDILPHLVGYTEEPKSRECIDVFGGLNIEVPSHVKRQSDTPYLKLEFEQHISIIRATYQEKYDDLRAETFGSNYDERYARSRNSFDDRYQLATVKIFWFRPWAFASSAKKEEYQQLSQKYPDGARVVIVNRQVLEVTNEALDDHWTLTFPMFSETIHAEAMGEGAIEIQELRNDGINLADQLIRHGVPETFADSEVLDFNAYKKSPKAPGQMFQVKPRPGQPIQNAFHTIKTSSLSEEVDVYIKRLDQDGQFITSAFPSIYGGVQQGGSKTLGEYSMSHSQALQRVSTYWKMMCLFWAQGISKATREYAQYLIDNNETDKYVKRNGNSFINVWTRHVELEGQVGSVEPDASEMLPMTPGQIRDLLTRVLQFKDPVLNNTLYHPENSQTVAAALGMPDLYIPGKDDRSKQLIEIQELANSQPIDETTPSVPIDPDVDDDAVHIQVLRAYLVSERGLDLRNTNQAGYTNCLLHLRQHVQKVQAATQQPNETPQGQPPNTNAVGR